MTRKLVVKLLLASMIFLRASTAAAQSAGADNGPGTDNSHSSPQTSPLVLPAAFEFHTVIPNNGKDPGGWKETDCVTIRFLRPGFFAPPTFFDIGIKVGVPIRNENGLISDWFAQDSSSEAATAAGLEIIAMLRLGSIIESQVQPLFVKKMSLYLGATIKGSRVTGCNGGSKRDGERQPMSGFRDTFAVSLLTCGVSLVSVSHLLGHQSIKITQRHYAPWVKARQDALDRELKRVLHG
jgi:hypothetical protein